MRFSKPLRAAAIALAALAVAPIVATATTASADGIAVVYVDIDRIEAEVDEGVAASVVLRAEGEKRQKELAAGQARIAKLQNELEAQAKGFSKAAIEKKYAEYQQAVQETQQSMMKFEKELDDKERELFAPIEKRLNELIRVVANRDGYALVLSKRAVPYGRADLDITDRMIQEYNKKYPSTAGKNAAKPASSSTAAPKASTPAPKASASVAPKMP